MKQIYILNATTLALAFTVARSNTVLFPNL